MESICKMSIYRLSQHCKVYLRMSNCHIIIRNCLLTLSCRSVKCLLLSFLLQFCNSVSCFCSSTVMLIASSLSFWSKKKGEIAIRWTILLQYLEWFYQWFAGRLIAWRERISNAVNLNSLICLKPEHLSHRQVYHITPKYYWCMEIPNNSSVSTSLGLLAWNHLSYSYIMSFHALWHRH